MRIDVGRHVNVSDLRSQIHSHYFIFHHLKLYRDVEGALESVFVRVSFGQSHP